MPIHPSAAGALPEQADAWADFALRTRSGPALARLEELGGEGRTDPAWTAALARTLALGGEPAGSGRGLVLLDGLVASVGLGRLPRPTATLWAQLLLHQGREQDLDAVVDDPALNLHPLQRWALRSDLANPHRCGAGRVLLPWSRQLRSLHGDLAGAEASWLETFNEVHLDSGLEPVRLRRAQPGDTAYRRLTAETGAPTGGGLVTVVMATHRPDRDLLMAVRGVLAQSWSDLELLVVDDASPPGSEALLAEAEGLDPRVRVVRSPANRGTYVARNLALEQARGRWMTFQDSDDWTHPRRLEQQVRHLLDSPGALANRTRAVRAFPDLSLTYVGYPPARLNASSLLFEIGPVRALVGGFDAVRKSADLELPLRLEAVRPGSCVDLRDPWPLAITQLRHGSLSRGDSVPGWSRWDRLAYRDLFTAWHEQIRTGRSAPHLPRLPRPFPVPSGAWEPERDLHPSPRRWEVAVLGDLREDSATAAACVGLARTAAGLGLSTTLVHAEGTSPLAPRREPVSPGTRAAVLEGIGLTGAEETDEVDLLVVMDPGALLHLHDLGLRVARSLVVLTQPPGPDASATAAWGPREVDRALEHWTGSTPTWATTPAAQGMRELLPSHRLLVGNLPLVAGPVGPPGRPSSRTASPRPARRAPMVVGHHLPDLPERWPTDARQLVAAYPTGGSVVGTGHATEVRTLAGLGTAVRILGRSRPPAAWLSLAGTGTPLRQFLGQLDAWVYQGRWDAVAEVAALQALDAGMPCVLPPEAAGSALGEAAWAVPPEQVHDTVRELLGPRAASLRAGRDLARTRRAQWAEVLHQLLAPGTAPGPAAEGRSATVTDRLRPS